jgi:hypothetical protein
VQGLFSVYSTILYAILVDTARMGASAAFLWGGDDEGAAASLQREGTRRRAASFEARASRILNKLYRSGDEMISVCATSPLAVSLEARRRGRDGDGDAWIARRVAKEDGSRASRIQE